MIIKNFLLNFHDPDYLTVIDISDITISYFQKHHKFIIRIIKESNEWDYCLPTKVHLINTPFCFKEIWKVIESCFSKELKQILEVSNKNESSHLLSLIEFDKL